MGKIVNATSFRLNTKWSSSRWYNKKKKKNDIESIKDLRLRKYIETLSLSLSFFVFNIKIIRILNNIHITFNASYINKNFYIRKPKKYKKMYYILYKMLNSRLKNFKFFSNYNIKVFIIYKFNLIPVTFYYNNKVKQLLNRFKLYKNLNNLYLIIFFSLKVGSAELLAKGIAYYCKYFKSYNKYFYFIRLILTNFLKKKLYFNFNKDLFKHIKGLRLEIKGRFNKVRSNKKIFNFEGVPLNTYDANVLYFYKTIFSRDGTFGLKIWFNIKKKKYKTIRLFNKKKNAKYKKKFRKQYKNRI